MKVNYMIDLESFELFKASLDRYVSEMRSTVGVVGSSLSSASLSARDSAVSGAVKEVEDSLAKIGELLDVLDDVSKLLAKKLVLYRDLDMKRRLGR